MYQNHNLRKHFSYNKINNNLYENDFNQVKKERFHYNPSFEHINNIDNEIQNRKIINRYNSNEQGIRRINQENYGVGVGNKESEKIGIYNYRNNNLKNYNSERQYGNYNNNIYNKYSSENITNSNEKYDPSRHINNYNYKDVLNQNRMDSNRNAKELYLNKENAKNYLDQKEIERTNNNPKNLNENYNDYKRRAVRRNETKNDNSKNISIQPHENYKHDKNLNYKENIKEKYNNKNIVQNEHKKDYINYDNKSKNFYNKAQFEYNKKNNGIQEKNIIDNNKKDDNNHYIAPKLNYQNNYYNINNQYNKNKGKDEISNYNNYFNNKRELPKPLEYKGNEKNEYKYKYEIRNIQQNNNNLDRRNKDKPDYQENNNNIRNNNYDPILKNNDNNEWEIKKIEHKNKFLDYKKENNIKKEKEPIKSKLNNYQDKRNKQGPIKVTIDLTKDENINNEYNNNNYRKNNDLGIRKEIRTDNIYNKNIQYYISENSSKDDHRKDKFKVTNDYKSNKYNIRNEEQRKFQNYNNNDKKTNNEKQQKEKEELLKKYDSRVYTRPSSEPKRMQQKQNLNNRPEINKKDNNDKKREIENKSKHYSQYKKDNYIPNHYISELNKQEKVYSDPNSANKKIEYIFSDNIQKQNQSENKDNGKKGNVYAEFLKNKNNEILDTKNIITTQKVLEIGNNQAIQNNLNVKYKYGVNSDETKKIIAPFIDVINNQQKNNNVLKNNFVNGNNNINKINQNNNIANVNMNNNKNMNQLNNNFNINKNISNNINNNNQRKALSPEPIPKEKSKNQNIINNDNGMNNNTNNNLNRVNNNNFMFNINNNNQINQNPLSKFGNNNNWNNNFQNKNAQNNNANQINNMKPNNNFNNNQINNNKFINNNKIINANNVIPIKNNFVMNNQIPINNNNNKMFNFNPQMQNININNQIMMNNQKVLNNQMMIHNQMMINNQKMMNNQINMNNQNQNLFKKNISSPNLKKRNVIITKKFANGLQNIGATCYMNATLQCLAHVENLTRNLLGKKGEILAKKDINKLVYSYLEVLENIWENDNIKDYPPYNFKDIISKMNPLFKGIQANDSKDLVLFLLENMHNQLNKVKNVNNQQNEEVIDQYNFYKNLKSFTEYFKKNFQSIISDIFYGMNNSQMKCLNCNIITHNIQCYNLLIIPLEEVRKFKNRMEKIVSIRECFEYNQKCDYMTGQNQIYCNNCKQMANSMNNTTLIYGPKVLIINLNRGKGLQFDVKINFDEYIDIKDFIYYKTSPSRYRLIGVVTHFGPSGMSGHFIAFCRSFIDNNWYKYNDSIVTLSNFMEVTNTGVPYILFYSIF